MPPRASHSTAQDDATLGLPMKLPLTSADRVTSLVPLEFATEELMKISTGLQITPIADRFASILRHWQNEARHRRARLVSRLPWDWPGQPSRPGRTQLKNLSSARAEVRQQGRAPTVRDCPAAENSDE
jgi:hypothetical protein